MSREIDFSAEQQRGTWLLYPETEDAQDWADINADSVSTLSGVVDADEELLQQLADEGFVIEGYNDEGG